MTTENTTTNDNIVRKIQKLLALGKRGGTEAEASAAMDMVQELLVKYNLDLAVVEAAAVEGGTVQAKEKREQTKLDRSAMYKWTQQLCRQIAEANFCFYWTQEVTERYGKADEYGFQKRRQVKRHVILGREANVVAVKMMYEYLADTLEALMPYPQTERLSRSAISWREGAAERLAERIRAKADQMRNPEKHGKTETKSTGLVLRTLAQAEYRSNYDACCGEGAYDKAMMRREEAKQEEKPLTAAEKAKQEKQNKKWWERYQREQQAAYDRRDHAAYRAGRVVGDAISLQDRLESKRS